ncbi:MAG: hypothetical protein METHP_01241 [Methanoregula sp. SKADARSKE-2]|nr:MAG: hypothetical protein METHP_01241 [Methanoregula sp. SKADARSKE-2]
MDNPPEREARIHWDDCKDPARNEDQLGKQYRETGIISVIGEALGRPKKLITAEESGVIENAFERFWYGARMLEMLIWKDSTVSISHNRIHRYLVDRGLAKAERSKRKQRKWVRYERNHSMSAGHIDWHEDPISELKISAILDDLSRKIRSGNLLPLILRIQITVVDKAIREYNQICPLSRTDYGSRQ